MADAPRLAAVADEVVAMVVGPAKASLAAFDNAVEDHLMRIDEISAIVDALRLEIQHTSDTAFPILLQNAQELAALYTVIDRVETAVERTAAVAAMAEERLGQVSAGYDSRYAPTGLKSITSLLSKAKATDAPVKLPPYDPAAARIDVAGELEALRGIVGEVAAVETGSLAAFVGGGEEGAAGGEAAEAEAGSGAAAEAEGEGAAAAAPAPAPAAATPGRRIAQGEDDEDEEEDEDD